LQNHLGSAKRNPAISMIAVAGTITFPFGKVMVLFLEGKLMIPKKT
jgi:hypothetical protein